MKMNLKFKITKIIYLNMIYFDGSWIQCLNHDNGIEWR